MLLRVVTWNLFHGRAVPGAGRDLLGEFGDALAGWEWDVAMLQEVPPWWPATLGRTLRCEVAAVRTSRNALGGLGAAAARRYPDVMKSWGGGANAILCRHDRIVGRAHTRLCRWPERRWALGVQLGCGAWVATLHASRGPSAAAARDVARAGVVACGWADGAPLVFAGDLNLRDGVSVDGYTLVGSSDVDHVLVAGGARAVGAASSPVRGALSDHAPLAVSVEVSAPPYHR